MEHIYIVLTQTGTVLSEILKFATGARYNHASLALTPELRELYSFGRLNPYNPIWAGFVVESPNWGTFKRFSETEALVLEVAVPESTKASIAERIAAMLREPTRYGYNYFGLWLAGLKVPVRMKNRWYCSEFVRDVLIDEGIADRRLFSEIVEPIEFLGIPTARVVYEGKLREFSPEKIAAVQTSAREQVAPILGARRVR